MSMKGTLFRLKLKLTKAFWVDKQFKRWKVEDVSDEYLKNIIFFISEGKGYYDFIHNKKRINRIFQEGYRRKVILLPGLLNLHQWALCYQGFSDAWPRYLFTYDNYFIDTKFIGKIEDDYSNRM